MQEEQEHVCPKCGKPKGRGATHGPLWTPQVKGVEVCDCPSEEEEQRARAAGIHEEVDALQHELIELEKER